MTDDRIVVAIALLTFVIGMGLGIYIGHNGGVSVTRQEAIDAEAAEWQIDVKIGERSFVFKNGQITKE